MDTLTAAQVQEVVEGLRYKKFGVLDDGHVMLVDVMGSDAAICEAARVSYGAGIQKRSGDTTLIRYLLRHRHTTPFEMVEFKFRVRVPMDCWRQWIRHRTASVNEYSTRYSEAIDERQKTNPESWRSQSQANKQGSAEFIDNDNLTKIGTLWTAAEIASAKANGVEPRSPGQHLSDEEQLLHGHVLQVYKERIGFGVAREQARKDLTLSTYTEAYWKMDLHNLIHFLSLRMDGHAQKEIREYAWAIGENIVSKVVPVTWQAFKDYYLESLHLTSLDVEVINKIASSEIFAGLPVSERIFLSFQHESWSGLERCRERDECLEKLRRLGLVE